MGISVSFILMFVFILLILFVTYILPVILGLVTIKDAKKRKMEVTPWVLLIILAPFPIGMIAYLICREKHKLYRCPQCGEYLDKDADVCHKCLLRFNRKCPQCGVECMPHWRNCPKCSAYLPPETMYVATKIKEKTHPVRNIILLILIIPLLVFGVYACIFSNVYFSLGELEEYYGEIFDEGAEIYRSEFSFETGELNAYTDYQK